MTLKTATATAKGNIMEPIFVQDTVKWIADSVFSGPGRKHLAVEKGRIYKVCAKRGDQILLAVSATGVFGWCCVSNVKKLHQSRKGFSNA